MSLIEFVVAALATWRISSLLVYEPGPFDVFERLRFFLGTHRLNASGDPKTFAGKLFSCIWCISVWVGIVTTIVVMSQWWFILIPFALSAASIILNRLVSYG